ncbi:glycoside hydrolase family 2 TIM barrel-domain containing protein [Pontiella sulfatireligans]|uniref:Beta-galactosidase BoGH2A n=1 Tax=Pontiella sulfatireligans TaxID=2750658 RepID=A0A6C2UT94_9BACT|nr:glycoside hydrolase family 2 TIM barrel-domain containing protein [Pontiella sulfatireligans]VGO22481.1 Beta-galactosidase BoGH2A [Pontiella sulfatireligans]
MKRIIISILTGTIVMAAHAESRAVDNFNADWKFNLGDVTEAKGAAYDDAAWRGVQLPHDWSVELSFTTEDAGGCTGFLPGGIGWYRKTFTVPASSKGRVVRVDFDGVYSNSEVWINGHHLGMHPYGYSPFSYDLSKHLNYGGENTIAVKADRTAYLDCRWYPGSGIYRNVKLVTHDLVHIQQHGVFVTTKGSEVTVRSSVCNGSDAAKKISIKTAVQEAGSQSLDIELAAGEAKEVELVFQIAKPRLWDTEHPNLYTASVDVLDGKTVLDNACATFGIREIRYDANEGFFLNGKRMLLKGVCLHHDGGCVGAAVPDGVWERRLRILKEGGCNAIRTAHNPPSAEFLDLCDRLGFLVQDEAFDEWFNPKDKKYNFGQKVADDRTVGYSERFGEWAERDVKAMVQRDRNHPSIIMWSIGNEIEWTYPGYGGATGYWEKENNVNYYWDEPPLDTPTMKERFENEDQGEYILAEQAADLSGWIKEIDVSRPVTANTVMPSISHFSGYADALDIVGYSYRTVLNKWGHENYPEKMILGTENWVQWNEWKGVLDNPHVPGVFLWTGIDYLGESTQWPAKASGSGMLDTAGFRKPNYWFFKTFWKESEPLVYIATQPLAESNYLMLDGQVVENPEKRRTRKWGWPDVVNHWNYQPGEQVYIELYSNCEETELFLNGKSLGVQKLADCEDRLMKWAVPFEAGELKAVGRTSGKETALQTLQTAGEPAALQLTADKTELDADGVDVAHCVVQLVDADGVPVKHLGHLARFTIEGDARNVGVDNGSPKSTQNFQSDTCRTDQGRCLMVLQAGHAPGAVAVTASADGLKSARVELKQD